jgi:hypothetical protein
MTTFLLGLSLGGGCLTHCGPVLLPMLLCEGARRLRLAAAFLAARLCGYALVAAAVWAFGRFAGAAALFNSRFFGAAVELLLGAYLLVYSLRAKKTTCGEDCAAGGGKTAFARFKQGGAAFAARTGFLTGLGFCAPMMALVAEGTRQGSFLGTAWTFFLFFLGTSAVLVPLFACGFACGGRTKTIREIGFLAGLAASALYLFQGTMLLITEVAHEWII